MHISIDELNRLDAISLPANAFDSLKSLVAISISEYNEEVKQTDLDWIYVSPDYHGKGVGRFLIDQTIKRCKDTSNDICVGGTVEFYRKCGF